MLDQLERPRRTAVMLDPHPVCHVALKTMLAPLNIELVAATASVCTAYTLLREHHPDLLLLEVALPGRREEALRLIDTARRENPELAVVVVSATDERCLVDAAFDHGARAYVLKTSEPDAIATAISQAFEPSLYLSGPRGDAGAPAMLDGLLLRRLTRREIEILQLVSGGRSNRQVAEILYVTDQTVKFHLANVYRKLGVGSRFEAARWAREQGLVDAATDAPTLPETPPARERHAVLVPLRPPVPAERFVREVGETSR